MKAFSSLLIGRITYVCSEKTGTSYSLIANFAFKLCASEDRSSISEMNGLLERLQLSRDVALLQLATIRLKIRVVNPVLLMSKC